MSEPLSSEERRFVTELLAWDAEQRQREGLLLLLALAGGGVMVVAMIAMTLRHLNDRFAAFVTVPGVALGVALILVWVLGKSQLEQRHRVAAILRKLGAGDAARQG